MNGLLAIGGLHYTKVLSSVELFDPTLADWRNVTDMPTGKRFAFGAAVLSTKVYVCGGLGDASGKSCIEYDPVANFWDTSIADMLEERSNFALVAMGGSLYAMGGYIAFFSSSSMERYNVSVNRWERITDLPFTVQNHAVASLAGCIYIAGGLRYSPSIYKTVAMLYKYDPLLDSWTCLADMPTPRYDLALVAVPASSGSKGDEGFLYAIGGFANYQRQSDTVKRYSVANDRWDTVSKMIQSRNAPGAALIGSDIYVVGGEDSYWHTLDTLEKLSLNSSDGQWINIVK